MRGGLTYRDKVSEAARGRNATASVVAQAGVVTQFGISLATVAPDDSAWLWANARRDWNRFSSLPNNSRHRPAIRSTRSSINSLMRIALTHRYRRTPHANIVTTRVRGMMRASVRQSDGD